ncbi:MAG: aminotransferase [Rhodobacteraceae bacterium]|nr:aminotransferase [Paracoccaceae bacterium]
MKIDTFGVEMWMNEWETKCAFNLAETCVSSLRIEELLRLSGLNRDDLSALLPLKMTYGDIKGSDRLRSAISKLYTNQDIDNILITHGTIGANMLVHKTLVEPRDTVISVVPTYQQHYSIPESIGADIQILKLKEAHGWLPDLRALRDISKDGAKLIALTNPNNPTGALISDEMLSEIAEIAREAGAWLLCDEVYRGTNQEGSGLGKSIADIYEKGISTAGMSKAFSLAGLRLGWITAPKEFIEDVMIHRDYDTISVGLIDDHFAALALENHDRLLDRSKRITRDNLATLEAWINKETRLTWIKPKAGTTALVKYDLPMLSYDFCTALLKKTGVMFTPGSALGMEGYVRVGYANSPKILKDGLVRVSEFLASH